MIVHSTERFSSWDQPHLEKNLDTLPLFLLARILSYVSVKDFWSTARVCKEITYQVDITWSRYLVDMVKKTSLCSEALLGRLLKEDRHIAEAALHCFIIKKCEEPSPDIDKLIEIMPRIVGVFQKRESYIHLAMKCVQLGLWQKAVECTEKAHEPSAIIRLVLKVRDFQNLKLFYRFLSPKCMDIITDIVVAQIGNDLDLEDMLLPYAYYVPVIIALLEKGRMEEARRCLPEGAPIKDGIVAALMLNNLTVENFIKLGKKKL
jgi:hypothetical protein